MRAAALVLLAVLAAAPLSAQDTAPAIATAEAYMEAFTTGDWRAAAERIDRTDLVTFQPFVALIGGMAVADPEFEGGPPPEDPVEAFAWFMGTMSEQLPMFGDLLGTADGDVLGAVTETDSLVHVVVRSTIDMMGAEVSQVDAVSVRLGPDAQWRVTLGGRLDALSQMMGAIEGDAYDGGAPDSMRDGPPGDKLPLKPRRDG